MADVTLTVDPQVWGEGVELGVFPVSNWPSSREPSGAPVGSAADTDEVDGGQVVFEGLSEGSQYWVTTTGVEGPWRYVMVIVPRPKPGSTIEPDQINAPTGTRVLLAGGNPTRGLWGHIQNGHIASSANIVESKLAAPAWVNLPVASPWVAKPDFQPQYRMRYDGTVDFRGIVTAAGGSDQPILDGTLWTALTPVYVAAEDSTLVALDGNTLAPVAGPREAVAFLPISKLTRLL